MKRAKVLVISIAILNILIAVVVSVLYVYLYSLLLVAGLSSRPAAQGLFYLVSLLFLTCTTVFLSWKIMRFKNLARVVWLSFLTLSSISLSVILIVKDSFAYETLIIFFIPLLNFYFLGLNKNVKALFY